MKSAHVCGRHGKDREHPQGKQSESDACSGEGAQIYAAKSCSSGALLAQKNGLGQRPDRSRADPYGGDVFPQTRPLSLIPCRLEPEMFAKLSCMSTVQAILLWHSRMKSCLEEEARLGFDGKQLRGTQATLAKAVDLNLN